MSSLLNSNSEMGIPPAHPRLWLAIVFLIAGTSCSFLWWVVGKQYQADHAPDARVTPVEEKPVEPSKAGSQRPPAAAPLPSAPQLATNESKAPWPPLRVTLRDGSVCMISLSVQYQILPENAPKVVADIGGSDKIRDFLKPVVENATLSTLSDKSLQQISRDMSSMSMQIREKVESRAESVGITVRAVYITALSPVSK
jgi:flagellar basal body-associated protein FliL